MDVKKEKIVDAITEYGGSATGAVVGLGVGSLVAGPIGAALGALAGTAIEKVFQRTGEEIKERSLSKNENLKIGVVFEAAQKRVASNLQDGKQLRTDEFFKKKGDDRVTADELLENLLFTSQRESEERKLPYMANLYANILFDHKDTWNENIDRETANQLIKVVGELSYRQIVIIAVIGQYQTNKLTTPQRRTDFSGYFDMKFHYIASEVYDMYLKSYIEASEIIPYAAVIKPNTLKLHSYGIAMYNLMELWKLPRDETMDDVLSYFSGKRISR